MDQTDAQVIRRVISGDTEAFALLVDRYHGRCLRTALHLLGDADEADDAVQEAFVRAYRHLGAYRERDRFAAWMLRIVVNQCRTRSTYARRWTRLDDPSSVLAATEHDSQRNETSAELMHALRQLGADQREAIVLRFGEELSYEEMASVTGLGVSALKMRVKRACLRLRALLLEQINA
jgi:RNA polymerase sigma-70 factor (ECF subfamily)